MTSYAPVTWRAGGVSDRRKQEDQNQSRLILLIWFSILPVIRVPVLRCSRQLRSLTPPARRVAGHTFAINLSQPSLCTMSRFPLSFSLALALALTLSAADWPGWRGPDR